MDDKSIEKGLKGFSAVWKRVQESKAASPSVAPDIKIMPRRENGGKHRRCDPRRYN